MILIKEQSKACEMALNNPYTCILGEGGTGKTYTLKAITKCLDERGVTMLILSAYGISEKTIKKHLFSKGIKGTFKHAKVKVLTIKMAYTLAKNKYDIEHKKFLNEVTHLCIDESQNNSTLLKSEAYKIVGSNLQSIIEFGDTMQVEPIGKGSPYISMSNALPEYCIRLTQNMRVLNEESSSIVKNARLIRSKDPDILNKLENNIDTGVQIITVGGKNQVINEIMKIHKQYTNDDKEHMNICIMTPMREDAKFLNENLSGIRKLVLKTNKDWKAGQCISSKREIKVGCRVQFLKNYREMAISLKRGIGSDKLRKLLKKMKKSNSSSSSDSDDRIFMSASVAHGETEWIEKIETMGESPKTFRVCTLYPSGRKVCIGYEHIDIGDVEVCDSRTIHKTLGDEENVCILYLGSYRNIGWVDYKLLYTACSRPRCKFYIIGMKYILRKDAFNRAVYMRNKTTLGKKYYNIEILTVEKQFEIMSQYIRPPPRSDLSIYTLLAKKAGIGIYEKVGDVFSDVKKRKLVTEKKNDKNKKIKIL